MQGSVLGASAGAVAKKSFDLSSQTDALALLNYVRGKAMDPELQNVTRNMILDYVFTPNHNLFTQITENLTLIDNVEVFDSRSNNEAQTVSLKAEEPVLPRASFGSARPKPIFAQNLPTTPTPTPTAAPLPDLKPTTVKEEVVQTEDVVSSASEVDPVPAVPVPDSPVDHLGRIKEIKKLVNEKVGNPVNLIDANNEVGREYMNALLDAMKKVHGGESSAVTAAMQRLETAYESVEKTLKETPLDTIETTPTPVAATMTAAPVSGFAAAAKSVEPTPAPEVTAAEPISAPVADPVPEPVTPATVPKSEPSAPEVSLEPLQDSPEPAVPSAGGLKSLATDLQNESIEKEKNTPVPEVAPASTNADPLMDPKITNGLDQLLSEWSLFKSSGLFGTGPSGREHPMYKTLAALPMSSVVSGRFEGASTEVKQSLTDYMNGWRYEQGMVHEIGETFEHYLRRVITAILAKQPKAE